MKHTRVGHQHFLEKYGFSLETIIIFMICLSHFITRYWKRAYKFSGVFRSWQRAYHEPIDKQSILDYMEDELPSATYRFGLSPINIKNEIKTAFEFLLTEEKAESINILLGGPHSIFLPINQDIYFIDYANFLEILYNLFFKVNLADQNFKGQALERYIENQEPPVTSKRLTALGHSQKQIDASYDLGNGLIAIIECKAKGRSFGYEGGF